MTDRDQHHLDDDHVLDVQHHLDDDHVLDVQPQLIHSPYCRNRRPPIIRLSWGMQPESWCPECGRYGAAPTEPGHPAQQPKETP